MKIMLDNGAKLSYLFPLLTTAMPKPPMKLKPKTIAKNFVKFSISMPEELLSAVDRFAGEDSPHNPNRSAYFQNLVIKDGKARAK